MQFKDAVDRTNAHQCGDPTEAFRANYRARHIPPWYRGGLHLLLTAASVIVPAGYCASQLRALRPLELLTVPVMLALGSLSVWLLHKYVLHRPLPGLRRLYVIHTLQHHRFYTYEHNEPSGPRDYHITLFPMVFGPTHALVSYVLGRHVVSAIAPNVGLLFSILAVSYYGLYELVHLASHLPSRAALLRVPPLRRLREHHRLHHDPRLMARKNFNVVLPLCDWLLSTLARKRPSPSTPGALAAR